MLFGEDRSAYRQVFCEAWRKHPGVERTVGGQALSRAVSSPAGARR